jgi:hypothetical protein
MVGPTSAYLDTYYHKEFVICEKSLYNLMEGFFCFAYFCFSQCVGVLTEQCWLDMRQSLKDSRLDGHIMCCLFELIVTGLTCKHSFVVIYDF